LEIQGSATSVPFIPDQKNGRRVFDPETGYALTKVFRDVPIGEAWFDFLFEEIALTVKSKFSWSDGGKKCTYVVQVQQLEAMLPYAPSSRRPAYRPSPQELRAALLPVLRDAIVAQHVRIVSNPLMPRKTIDVDVEFVDRTADGNPAIS
jgi:hypothetical protein